ncbi:NAD(P)H:quinone oxidoreductase [Oecophyllibacter saccharovorans]|uniref:NAD(P)H dehydrogenase (quinone) n=1 Tax=Oecophyllibacter saccharovorans TaxID=2558360 RepID=A0A506US40_9PROT|nr:NAD(P)H:quinone oxidoreductase [Oecophyllibacter saccharovorans]TPW35903.1 NAD(P)H:quinone oxidoreductase [Oecophyllibacter saccharovorans]
MTSPTPSPAADPSAPRVLVLYYSTYGHVETLAGSVVAGARQGGAETDLRRVPELVPPEVAQSHHFKLDQPAPLAEPETLADYDGIIVGAPTRFGRMPSQMAAFWERTGGLWLRGALIGKVGAAFTSSGTQHGGQETTLYSIITNLLAHGMVISGLPYSFQGLVETSEVSGGAPWGAGTIAGTDGSRHPIENEKQGAFYLGQRVARLAARLKATEDAKT